MIPRTVKRALALAIALAAFGCASTPEAPAPPFVLQPVDDAGTALPIETPLLVEHPGVKLTLQSLTARGRELWLRQNTGLDLDPLGQAPTGSRFLSVRVRIESTGDMPIHIESQAIRLWLSSGEASSPTLDYTRAYELLRPDIEGPGPAQDDIERFMRGLLDGAIDLLPGQTREGLLVFPEPEWPKQKNAGFVLEIPFLQVGSKSYRVKMPFVPSPLVPAATAE